MRFHLTLTVPSRNGNATQFVICDHDAVDVEELNDILNSDDHILVREVNTDRGTGKLVPGEMVSLHERNVAKATIFIPRDFGN